MFVGDDEDWACCVAGGTCGFSQWILVIYMQTNMCVRDILICFCIVSHWQLVNDDGPILSSWFCLQLSKVSDGQILSFAFGWLDGISISNHLVTQRIIISHGDDDDDSYFHSREHEIANDHVDDANDDDDSDDDDKDDDDYFDGVDKTMSTMMTVGDDEDRSRRSAGGVPS